VADSWSHCPSDPPVVALSPAERAHRLVEATFARPSGPSSEPRHPDAAQENGCPSEDGAGLGGLAARMSPEPAANEASLDQTLLSLQEEIDSLIGIRNQILRARQEQAAGGVLEVHTADPGPLDAVCDAPPEPATREFAAGSRSDDGLNPWALAEGGKEVDGSDSSAGTARAAALNFISSLPLDDDLDCTEAAVRPHIAMWIPKALTAPDDRRLSPRPSCDFPEGPACAESNGRASEEKDNSFEDAQRAMDELFSIRNIVTIRHPSCMGNPPNSRKPSFATPPYLRGGDERQLLQSGGAEVTSCTKGMGGPSGTACRDATLVWEPLRGRAGLADSHGGSREEANVDEYLIQVPPRLLQLACAQRDPAPDQNVV